MNTNLLGRYLVVPIAAVVVLIFGYAVTAAMDGGISAIFLGKSSNSELCSAYRTAEKSWDSDSFTSYYDTDDIESLAGVAKRYPDDAVKDAGKRIDNLDGSFSYTTYSGIVRPIAREC